MHLLYAHNQHHVPLRASNPTLGLIIRVCSAHVGDGWWVCIGVSIWHGRYVIMGLSAKLAVPAYDDMSQMLSSEDGKLEDLVKVSAGWPIYSVYLKASPVGCFMPSVFL